MSKMRNAPKSQFVEPFKNVDIKKSQRTVWMVDPALEGTDHININSESRHKLGRWFHPRAAGFFTMDNFGSFNTIEAFLYFVLAHCKSNPQPEVIASVDQLRNAPASALTVLTNALPAELRHMFFETYRLPTNVYRSVIDHLIAAYLAKLEILAVTENVDSLVDTSIARCLIGNTLSFYGYFINEEGAKVNLSQRTTVFAAIAQLTTILRDRAAQTRSRPMKAALEKAGLVQTAPGVFRDTPGTVSTLDILAEKESVEAFRQQEESLLEEDTDPIEQEQQHAQEELDQRQVFSAQDDDQHITP